MSSVLTQQLNMENQQCPRICPLCGAPVGLFYINFTEKLLMCEDPMCDFPFGYEELQIVTDESQLRDNVEWSGARNLPDNDVSSASSIVSTSGWADIEQLTRLYDSDSCTTDSKLSQQSQLAKKRKEKKKYEEEMAKNLNYIKKLNDELNQLKRTERYSRIEKDNLLENLLRLQKMSGRQMLKREELENLQKKKEAEFGMGELKINVNTVPNEMGVINIEICNKDNKDNETNCNEDMSEEIAAYNNKIDSNETDKINTNVTEDIEATITLDKKSETINTATKTNEEATKDGNFTVNINNNNHNLQNLDIMDEGITEDNEGQCSVNPGDNLQTAGNVQVLGLIDDFPLITLEELTSSVVSEGPVLQEAMIDEMQLIMMDEGVQEEMQVTVVEQQTTLDDKMQVIAENDIEDTIENKMDAISEKDMKVNIKNKMHISAENMQDTTEKDLHVATKKIQVMAEKNLEVSTGRKLQLTAEYIMPVPAEKMQVIAENMQVTSDFEIQAPAIAESQAAATIDSKVPTNEANFAPESTAIITAKSPSVQSLSTSEPISPAPKKKRGRPKKVLVKETRGRPRKVPKETIAIPDTQKTVNDEIDRQIETLNNSLVSISSKEQSNSEIEMISTTISSNIDQNQSIEGNDEVNTSAESSVVNVSKRGRKKGQKGVKRTVSDIRRSNRLFVKNI